MCVCMCICVVVCERGTRLCQAIDPVGDLPYDVCNVFVRENERER